MITIQAAMLVILGFLSAALLVLGLIGPYRRRIRRFATEQVKRSLPLTENEIRADKDSIRAQYAIAVHKLEKKVEDAETASARQFIEINRRDAKIADLEHAIEQHKLSFEEHENARRVLEQAIIDRLPKVESRLNEARKLLAERDREIALLSETASKQTDALTEATQINVQQADELDRLKAALATRAARNREAVGDPRFDGEVALRTEIEMLRARTRDQQAMISRLQSGEEQRASDEPAGSSAEADRLRAELARVEAQLLELQASDTAANEAEKASLRELEQADREHIAQIAKLTAQVQAYEQANSAQDARSMAAKAEISALQTEIDEHKRSIEAMRAEIAGSNERLARQGQHFRDELRRLGSQEEGLAARRMDLEASRRSLAERIAQPRSPRVASIDAGLAANDADLAVDMAQTREQRSGSFLKALSGGAKDGDVTTAADPADQSTEAAEAAGKPVRRSRLLERISNIEKS